MAVVAISDSILTDIADAIRSKNGQETLYKPSEMPDAIEAISGGITPTGTIEITENGIVDVTNYASADVDVPSETPTLGTKTITQNGTYDAEDDSLDGYSEVTVNVSGGITPTGTKQISITQNGTTTEDVTNYANAEITVNVSGGGSIGTWEEVTVTTAATNAQGCINSLLPNRETNKEYFICLYNKNVSDYVNNQLVIFSLRVNDTSSNMVGGGVRYRNNAYGGFASVANNYDCAVAVGDTYLIGEIL